MVVSSTTTNIVKLGSHLDVRNVSMARTTLYSVIQDATDDVILDMSSLEIIDATGLGMLTAMHLRCERRGLRLVLRNCPRDLRRLLAVTRLNRILHVDRAHSRLSA